MRITSVTANQHVSDRGLTGKPFRILLTFDYGQTLRLGVAGDGCRMTLDNVPLDKPFDMEKYGKVAVGDVTASLFPSLQNADVTGAFALQLGDHEVGLRLMLVGGDAFHFWVDGDELFWGDEHALKDHRWLDGLVPVCGKPVQV